MVATDRSVSVGSILSGTFRTIGASPLAVGLYFAVFASGGVLAEYVNSLGSQEYVIAGGALQIGFGIGAIFGGYLLIEAMLKQAGLFDNDGPRRFFTYLGQAILIGMGTILGLILLIVPGIIFSIRWMLASTLLIGTGAGATEGIDKSWQLTRGHTWTIFLATLPLVLLFLIAIGGAFAIAQEGGSLAAIVVQSFATELISIVSAAMSVTLFGLIVPPTDKISEIFA